MELWIAVGVGAVVLVYGVVTFNTLVALRQRARQSYSDIDVQLKLRHDLVPNLVDTVRGYAEHERDLFETIANVRAEALRPHAPRGC